MHRKTLTVLTAAAIAATTAATALASPGDRDLNRDQRDAVRGAPSPAWTSRRPRPISRVVCPTPA